MAVPADWVEHRRGDGERLGWIVPLGESFAVVDLLGRTRGEGLDWLSAEVFLDELGIGYLADPHELLLDGQWRRVRIREVSTQEMRLDREDWGDMTAPPVEHVVPFPNPEMLRPHTG